MRLELAEELDSTSLHARRMLEAGTVLAADGPVLVQAVRQTGGMGRRGRTWSSPAGGLWCTLLAPMPGGRADLFDGLGLRVGVACAMVVRGAMAGSGREEEVRLKWPNDVLIAGRKVLGVLCEVVPRKGEMWVLAGVGINANFAAGELPRGLRRAPTTLRDELGRDVDLAALRSALCAALMRALETPLDHATLAAARGMLYGIGEAAGLREAGGGEITGTLVGLSDVGAPVIRTAEGDVTAPAGSELVQGGAAKDG